MAPLTDKNLLEYVSLLIGKVKESQEKGKSLDKVYTLLEFLLSYRDAETDSPKKKAYEAVNSYQQQVDLAINELENSKNLAGSYLKKLVASQNQAELNLIYEEVKKSPEFSQTDNQKVVNNHHKRTQTALELENNSAVPEVSKQLAIKLRVVINGDSDTKELENLQKELKKWQNSSAEGKKVVYSEHSEVIEATLAEITSELARRNQSKQDQEKVPSSPSQPINTPHQNKGLATPAAIFIISVGLLISVIFLTYQVFHYRKLRQKKLLSKKKRKNR